jgi:ABC-2 family transporter protein
MAGFGRLLAAEWTKLRSVPRWAAALLAAAVLTVVVSLLGAAGSGSDANRHWDRPAGPDGRAVTDAFHFVHRPLSGDGSVTARVRSQAGAGGTAHEWARAGLMVKDGTEPGSRYAAIMVTPGHGVRLQANFAADLAGGAGSTPRWLRLTRAGAAVTGYESADGAGWRRLGTVDLGTTSPTLQVGLFVASPGEQQVERQFGSAGIGERPTASTAGFDNLRVEPGPAAPWRAQDVGRPESPGQATATGDGFTVTGSGDIGLAPPDDDVVRLSLAGAFVGLMVVVGIGVVFVTAEYRRGMIRTTFAASPRRGRVLVAKALVLGAVTFVAGLAACLAAFQLGQPMLRANGLAPPAFPRVSLADGPALRAVVGTAAVLALVAVLGLGAGAILRRSAAAIAGLIVLLVLPQLVAGALPLTAARWLLRVTPAAGFAIQQTVPQWSGGPAGLCLPESGCFPEGPWVGFGVLCAWAAGTLAAAAWLVRRRDA